MRRKKIISIAEYHFKVLTTHDNWVKIANNILRIRNLWLFGDKPLLAVQIYSFFVMHPFQQLRHTSCVT